MGKFSLNSWAPPVDHWTSEPQPICLLSAASSVFSTVTDILDHVRLVQNRTCHIGKRGFWFPSELVGFRKGGN